MNKNILMVAYTNYSTDARVVKEAEAAVSGGFNVDFITLRRPGDKPDENLNGVNVIRVKQYRYRGADKFKYILGYIEFFFRVMFKSFPLYLKRKYVIAHVNNMPDFMVFSVMFLKLFGIKVILDIHDPMPNVFLSKMPEKHNFLHKLLVLQERLSTKFADRVIMAVETFRDTLLKDGVDNNKLTVVANFADEKFFKVNNGYEINGKVRMIYHGTIAERWGLQKIILALSKIKQKEKFQFRIIGEGDFSDEITNLIKENNLESVVCFDNNFYPFSEIGSYLKDYHLGVASLELTPHTDTALSTKMIEYIATGIPVLTIKNKAVSHYFGQSGCFFYDPDNIDTIVDVFNRLAEDSSLLLSKRNEVLDLRENFVWLNEKKKYLKLLNELAAE